MKITRQRLKDIIMEEIALQEGMQEPVHVDIGNSENPDGMDEITEDITSIMESEALPLINDIAQVLADSNLFGSSDPKEMANALMGLGKLGAGALGAGALGTAALAGKDAIAKIFGLEDETISLDKEPEDMQEEAQEGTLEELITQAIQEELAQM